MPDAFFQKKRKRTSSSGAPSRNASSKGTGRGGSRAGPSSSSSRPSGGRMRRKDDDDKDDEDEDDEDGVAGAGIDDMDLQHSYTQGINSDEEADAAETPAEARVRLAKMYLQGLQTGRNDDEGDDFFESADLPDAAQADRENISARLQKDVAEQSGNIHLFIANRIATPEEYDYSAQSMLAVRGHRLSVTAAIASQDAKSFFTASKDGNLIRWRLRDGKMLRVFPKRPKFVDPTATSRSLTTHKSNRSKTSGAARRRERLSKPSTPALDSLPTKGKAKAPEAAAPLTNGVHGSSSRNSTYLTLGANEGHTDEIWSLSISSDGKYLASAGKDRRICVWSLYDSDTPTPLAQQESFVKALGGHKDSISAVCFRPGSQELYSASLDRTLKLFDVSQLSYIETLFGHQESILSLSCLRAETAVTAGGRDRTCRYWKIRDESQLVFRAGIKSRIREVLEGGDLARLQESATDTDGATASSRLLTNPNEAMEGSVECVAMIDSHHFLSGGDSGSIALWNLGKKKPIFSVAVAHGFEVTESETEGSIRTPRWITSLAALPYGDLFVSGSWDGQVRVWGLTAGGPGGIRGFRQLFALDVEGVINSLQIVLPPLSTVVVPATDDDAPATNGDVPHQAGLISSLAARPEEWKRTRGLVQSLATPTSPAVTTAALKWKKLPNIAGTKDNTPPILIIGVGQEHKFGRWIKQPHAKNGALVIPLQLKTHDQMHTERALRKQQHLTNGLEDDDE